MTPKQIAELIAAMRAAQETWDIVKDNSFYSEIQQKIAHRNCVQLEAAVDAALLKMTDKDFEPDER